MTDKKNKDLYYLDDLSDYKVASGYSDVRGWVVKDAENRAIGRVEGLLASKSAERVVYLDVEVDEDLIEEGHRTYATSASKGVHGFKNEEGENHLIIPIGLANLDEDENEVHTDRINRSTFARADRFKKDTTFDQDYEVRMYQLYTGDTSQESSVYDDKFYNRKEFDRSKTRNTSR
ncbi:MAG: photosystem reaction center subunit H [Bacteroidetes bacterium]|nr:photosystem reaction center subunit H [Bacteroidota bacterium]